MRVLLLLALAALTVGWGALPTGHTTPSAATNFCATTGAGADICEDFESSSSSTCTDHGTITGIEGSPNCNYTTTVLDGTRSAIAADGGSNTRLEWISVASCLSTDTACEVRWSGLITNCSGPAGSDAHGLAVRDTGSVLQFQTETEKTPVFRYWNVGDGFSTGTTLSADTEYEFCVVIDAAGDDYVLNIDPADDLDCSGTTAVQNTPVGTGAAATVDEFRFGVSAAGSDCDMVMDDIRFCQGGC